MKINNYTIIKEVYKSDNTLIYKAVDDTDNTPVVLKVLNDNYPSPEKLNCYKQEFSILNQLNIKGVIRTIGLERWKSGYVLILENVNAISLKEYINQSNKEKPVSLTWFLNLAASLTEIIGNLHRHNIIHKDINPSNILINPEDESITLIDFGIATSLAYESPTIGGKNVMEGTLPYISPEQTGRMNRTIDYRTDFYSLGVTLYEILTKQLPFSADDFIEYLYAHIARQARSPHQLSEHIPRVISDIVMKLLSKTAEERYRSAWGLLADLKKCQAQLTISDTIEYFSPGSEDVPDKFEFPQKIYGRESEIYELMSQFKQVSEKGKKLLLVTGPSGIGKSAMINEVNKTITGSNGFFVSGKFDQLQKNIPYSALIVALSNLVRQLLTERKQKVELWREGLAENLDNKGQLMVDFIPELELIIGPQPALPELGMHEAEKYFDRVFLQFLRTFCSASHPLVIFLDDLQWIDQATLRLIDIIMHDETLEHLLLIGAFRDNEVDTTHPLSMKLGELLKEKLPLKQINLKGVDEKYFSEMTAETLYCSSQKVSPLVALVYKRTLGNPFFYKQFCQKLYENRQLTFDIKQHCWEWDINQVRQLNISDNVVELMIEKLCGLSDDCQELIKYASCIGNKFELDMLSVVFGQGRDFVYERLLPAVKDGLIIIEVENELKKSRDSSGVEYHFRFAHDRIQQAAYQLINSTEKKQLHLKIGRLLNQHAYESHTSKKLFDITDHFNNGHELIEDESEIIQLIELNCAAGVRAKKATAYLSSVVYFRMALSLLPDDIWDKNYALALKLMKNLAETEYLTGDFERSKEIVDQTLSKALSNLDKMELYRLLILQLTARAQYAEAIQVGCTALKLLGIDLPSTEEGAQAIIDEERQLAEHYTAGRDLNQLEQDEVTSAEVSAAIEILVYIIAPCFYISMPLFMASTLKCVNLSLKHGSNAAASYGYANYALILSVIWKEYKKGYSFGELSARLNQKYKHPGHLCKSSYIFANYVFHWGGSLREADTLNDQGYQAGMDAGEFLFASNVLIFKIFNPYYSGENLETLLEYLPNYLSVAEKVKNRIGYDRIRSAFLPLANLTGKSTDMFSFDSEQLSEKAFIGQCEKNGSFNAVCLYNVLKSQILYLYGAYEPALKCAQAAEENLKFIVGLISMEAYLFYHTLIMAELMPTLIDKEVREEFQSKITNNLTQLKEWSELTPQNFRQHYLLLQAELAKLNSDTNSAMTLYDEAIQAAQENQFIQDEALANERAAIFWLSKNKPEFAKGYIFRAHYCYGVWGAKNKLKQLESDYPEVFREMNKVDEPVKSATVYRSVFSKDVSEYNIDLLSAVKASQAISDQLTLEGLFSKLLQIIAENAGAEIGSIAIKDNDQWRLWVMTVTGQEVFDITGPLTLEEAGFQGRNLVSEAVFNYVVQTKQVVLLDDASSQGEFANAPEIMEFASKSLLCSPIINKGELRAVLYLENRLSTHVFTSDRLQLLELLASQAAISIDNALLYENLEEKVQIRTAALEAAKKEAEHLARTDPLTGISNRRFFFEKGNCELSHSLLYKRSMSVIMLDIDYFKRINDTYGHHIGDEAIKCIVRIVKESVRTVDIFGRLGGEEFALILPDCELAEAEIVAERIRYRQEQAVLSVDGHDIKFTVSLGLSGYVYFDDEYRPDLGKLLEQADKSLYLAKEEGRNQVRVYEPVI